MASVSPLPIITTKKKSKTQKKPSLYQHSEKKMVQPKQTMKKNNKGTKPARRHLGETDVEINKQKTTFAVEQNTDMDDGNADQSVPVGTVSPAEKRPAVEPDDDERHLESLVFGLETDLVAELRRPASPDLEHAQGGGLFRLDRRGDVDDDDDGGDDEKPEVEPLRQPAWVDEDDEHVTVAEVEATFAGERRTLPSDDGGMYRSVLQKKFSTLVGEPEWASLDRKRRRDSDDDEEDAADALLTKTGRLLAAGDKPSRLAKGTILTKKCSDLTCSIQDRPKLVTAVEFHPRSQVALVGGGGRPILELVQVDGVDNPFIQMVPVESDFRVHCAHFSADGEHVIASAERAGHLLNYEMMSGGTQRVTAARRLGLRSIASFTVSADGRWVAVPGPRAGAVHLLSSRSHEWVDTLQASGRVSALAFSPDGTRLYTHSDEGQVYEWDMSARQCVHKFADEGCLSGTAVAMSPDGRLLACGSASGIVNVYETAAARVKQYPAPVKVLDHLTTQCDQLLFNATSELLAMSSRQKEHAVRLVHVPSMTVFSNFPGWSQAVSEPQRLDFSLSSGYLAVGNNKSRALLYRLQHYSSF